MASFKPNYPISNCSHFQGAVIRASEDETETGSGSEGLGVRGRS